MAWTCVFPDYTNSKARSWWANLVKEFVSNGVDGIWNDMNEPAVFKVVTKTMPENNIHRGDDDLGGVQNHSYYHNVYGMLMSRSTYEGMELADKNKRPFVLTRAGFIGSQRYAATWTGDNLSNWEHLHMSISLVLQLIDAVVYLVDAYDKERFAESKKELDALLSDESLANVPFLVLGNKLDIPYAASEDELRYNVGLTNFTTGKGKVNLA